MYYIINKSESFLVEEANNAQKYDEEVSNKELSLTKINQR